MKKRILLLVTDLNVGGTPTVVRELAAGLAQCGDFSVHVACLGDRGPVANQIVRAGVEVTALGARTAADWGVVGRLISLIRRENVDTVFSFLVHANAVSAVAARFTPAVRYLQSIQTTQPQPRWHWMVQEMAAQSAECVVVPSPSVARAAREWAGIATDRIMVIPNGVKIADFVGLERKQTGKRVGFIGRLDPVKRVEDLVEAMALLPAEFSLEIYGDGPQRGAIRLSTARLGLESRVNLRGTTADPAAALGAIDVLVLPSEAEGFGLVLIEAMAAGVPVIGTNVSGIRDVIEDGASGLLAPAKNPPALAAAIERVLNDPDLARRLVAGGRQRVESAFRWEDVFERYRELLAG